MHTPTRIRCMCADRPLFRHTLFDAHTATMVGPQSWSLCIRERPQSRSLSLHRWEDETYTMGRHHTCISIPPVHLETSTSHLHTPFRRTRDNLHTHYSFLQLPTIRHHIHTLSCTFPPFSAICTPYPCFPSVGAMAAFAPERSQKQSLSLWRAHPLDVLVGIIPGNRYQIGIRLRHRRLRGRNRSEWCLPPHRPAYILAPIIVLRRRSAHK